MNVKYVISLLATIATEWLCSYLCAKLLDVALVEVACFVGLMFLILFIYFNTKGGVLSKWMDAEIQATTGLKTENAAIKIRFTPVLAGLVLYFIITMVWTLVVFGPNLIA
ncbi:MULTISPECIES: hypothetical protein [Laceyella]|jgi:hypothetical protein|uniref:DUF3899 domain-containing protein n=1 Tax=Laceyella sediminis TaxID=573074 RepID=A0ABX5EU30_9BACL|nr:hypothetical protein [Laceyella sediminis]MRG28750.1 hypothetical protein [Laceyella tengchongensis]PRZ17309.1 hypothetical protein CLV36_101413 [Laceyella sediminis]